MHAKAVPLQRICTPPLIAHIEQAQRVMIQCGTCVPGMLGPVRCRWSVETAKQNSDVSVVDERKSDQVVSELDRYRVVVGALQETRWFGCETY